MVGHHAILFARPRFAPSSAAQIAEVPIAVTDKSERRDQLGLAVKWEKL
jgi:hypothetical protein